MGAHVIHFEVTGKDGKKLQNFYSEIFGWSIDSSNPMNYGIVPAPEGGGIGGGVSGTEGGGPGYVTFYVAVDDPQATLDAIEAAGGRTVMPVTEIPGTVTLAQFQDPAGNMVGIIKS